MREGCCGTSIIGSWCAALPLHLHILLLPGRPTSIICRSTPIDSLVCANDSALPVHADSATMLGYVHYSLSICYSTPPSPPPAPHWYGKICLSPPPPLSLAEDWATSGVQWYRDDGDELGDGALRSYRGNSSYHCTRIIHSIFPNLSSHMLFPRFPQSTKLCGSWQPGGIIPIQPVPMLPGSELIYFTNSW